MVVGAGLSLLAGCGSNSSSGGAPSGGGAVNSAPVFVSDVNLSVPENVRSVATIIAQDVESDMIHYSIAGGVDAEKFQVDGATGELSFNIVPDHDAPEDNNANNTYVVVLAASDGTNTTLQTFTVSVGTGLVVSAPADRIKTLGFAWKAVNNATHYALYGNHDGISGYTKMSGDVAGMYTEVTVPVHVTDWHRSLYLLEGYEGEDLIYRSDPEAATRLMLDSIGYIKASNSSTWDLFGGSVALSADGNTLAVGAPWEDSAATGIDGNQSDNAAGTAGAVYVFTRAGGRWTQQAYIKASNAGAQDGFGSSVALSDDGNTLAVGARTEEGGAIGVDGDQSDNTAVNAGAVYVLARSDGVWRQQAYVKASNVDAYDRFGVSVALSADGAILAVGAPGEDSAATGVDGDQRDNTANSAGAVYIFAHADGGWAQQAYVKASNTDAYDRFGVSVALSNDGVTLAVGSRLEDSAAAGIDGDQRDNTAEQAGAVYVFVHSEGGWGQQAYIKASNADAKDEFGVSVALSADGNTLAVGAGGEGSAATGVDGDQRDNTASGAGAVYVFSRDDGHWAQQAYVKASNAEGVSVHGFGHGDFFSQVALSADGNTLVVGAKGESSAAKGVGGDQYDNTASEAGAVYVFIRAGDEWTQRAYVKAPNGNIWDRFGSSVALSANGDTLAVAAPQEGSAATGIGGEQDDNSMDLAGAVYLY